MSRELLARRQCAICCHRQGLFVVIEAEASGAKLALTGKPGEIRIGTFAAFRLCGRIVESACDFLAGTFLLRAKLRLGVYVLLDFRVVRSLRLSLALIAGSDRIFRIAELVGTLAICRLRRRCRRWRN